MRLVHFSDVHIQVDYAKQAWAGLGWRRWAALVEMLGLQRSARYVDAEATLRRLADAVDAQHADHAVLSGDLTAMALPEEFERARACLGALAETPGRLTVIPGNHDVYAPDASTEDRFGKSFGHLLTSDLPELAREGPYPLVHLVGDDVAVVGLNSGRVPLSPGIARGWIGQRQLDGLARLLNHERVRERFVFVAVHHAPLLADGRPDSPTHRLADYRELLDLLPEERSALLFGHKHHRFHLEPAPGRPHLFGAGSSTSKGDEGYWVIDVEHRRITSATAVSLATH